MDFLDAEHALHSNPPAVDAPRSSSSPMFRDNQHEWAELFGNHDFVAEPEHVSTPSSVHGRAKVDVQSSSDKGKRKMKSMNQDLNDAAAATLKGLRDICGQLLVEKSSKASKTAALFAEMETYELTFAMRIKIVDHLILHEGQLHIWDILDATGKESYAQSFLAGELG